MLVGTTARRTSQIVSATPDPVVLIRSSAYASLPAPGNRVGTGDATNMPTIQASTGNSAIVTADGAHHYRLVGLNIKAPATLLQTAVLKIGGGETTLAEFPTDIVIDRCIVQGDATVGLRRGVQLDGIRCAVVDSYIYNCKEAGADTQAVWAYNTPGPLKIVNNYLEAAGENVMFGGADPSYTNSIPSDIEIRRNYFFKPLAWIGSSWTVKNLLEFKNGQRVLCEGNILENNWAAGQNGMAFLITPRNQDNTAPWCTTRDITFRYNQILNSEQGFNISGTDDTYTSEDTFRVNIEHNLLETAVVSTGGDGKSHQMISGPTNVWWINNTFVNRRASGGTAGFNENNPKADRTIWRNNIFDNGDYGIIGTSSGPGDTTFSAWFTNHSYTYNLLYRYTSGTYTGTGNQNTASTATSVFNDYANDDYTVVAAYQGDGSDGNDPGPNWTNLNTLTANTVTGQWGSEPDTYTDHTYTNAELPRSYVDSRYANQAGTEWICTTAAEFTTALAGCVVGDIITLTAGNTFTGSFTLRNI